MTKHLRSRTVAVLLMVTAAVLIFILLYTDRSYYAFFDGEEMIFFQTDTKDVKKALQECGISIGPYDSVVVQESADSNTSGVKEVVIERAGLVTVAADNGITVVVSSGETVGALLNKSGIKVGDLDEVTPELGSVAKAGTNIVVHRVGFEIAEEIEILPYKEIRVANSELAYGTERVVQEGRSGELAKFYEISLNDGKEVNRRFIKEVVTIDPQDEIIEYGTSGSITTFSGETYIYTRKLECIATAYSSEGLSNKLTALGTIARVGAVAVDPRVIPLRSRVYIVGTNGKWDYPVSRCEDTGGLIKGNRVDVYFDTQAQCYNFGVRRCYVYVLK